MPEPVVPAARSPALCDAAGAARYLCVSSSTIARLQRRRLLPVVRLGRAARFRFSDLDRLVSRGAA